MQDHPITRMCFICWPLELSHADGRRSSGVECNERQFVRSFSLHIRGELCHKLWRNSYELCAFVFVTSLLAWCNCCVIAPPCHLRYSCVHCDRKLLKSSLWAVSEPTVSAVFVRERKINIHATLINLLMPIVNYSGRTAPLTSKVTFYVFIQQI